MTIVRTYHNWGSFGDSSTNNIPWLLTSFCRVFHFLFLFQVVTASHSPFVPFIIICCGTFLILFLLPLVCIQKIFYKGPRILAVIIWIVLTATVMVYMSVLPHRTVDDDLGAVFYIIIVLYTMLPLSVLWSLLLGLLSSLLQLLIAGLFTSENKENLVFQVSQCTIFTLNQYLQISLDFSSTGWRPQGLLSWQFIHSAYVH